MKSIRDAGLNTKLFFISLIKLGMFAVIFVVIIWCLYQNTQKWEEFQNKHLLSMSALYDVHKNIGYNCGIHAFKNYVLRGEEFYYSKSKDCFENALQALSKLEKKQKFKSYVGVIKNTINLYIVRLENIKTKMGSDNFREGNVDDQVRVDDGPAQKALSGLENEILTGAQQLQEEVESFQKASLFYIGVLFSIVFIVILVINLYLGSSIVKNISILQKSARSIADGDLDEKIYKTSDDEMGQLAKSLDVMRVRIKKYFNELKYSNKELEQFAFVTSHDLQEPLRKIISFGELLQKSSEGELNEKSKVYLSKIIDSSLRMRTLIDDLLSYSRVSSAKENFKSVDLNIIVKGVLNDLELSIEQTGAQLKIDTLPTVQADPVQMQQLFQNLISNSLKFRRTNELSKISVMCGITDSKMAKITVEDNGIGIDEKYFDRIIVPFQRLHSRSEYDGTGIGLALCNKIVARHGGKLEIQSKINEGSSFSFNLHII